MLLNRSIKRLPASTRHNSAKVRLADLISWLESRPSSEAMVSAIAHLTSARRVISAAWSEFADLKPAPDPENAEPPAPRAAKTEAPRRRGRFASKERAS